MSRLADCFARLEAKGKSALVVYLVAGDPVPSLTVSLMHQIVEAGADVIELGVPFSDPEADGPVIQAGAERALAQGVSLGDVLSMVEVFRLKDQQTPVVLMGYLNPVEVMGYDQFARRCGAMGVDGTITVNKPADEAVELDNALLSNGVDPIYLLSPTTSEERAKKICQSSRGFVYYVSLKGVTGAASLDIDEVKEKLQRFRQLTQLPVCVGFGIKDQRSAAQVAAVAEGVVVGSVPVDIVARHKDDLDAIGPALSQWVADIRRAMG